MSAAAQTSAVLATVISLGRLTVADVHRGLLSSGVLSGLVGLSSRYLGEDGRHGLAVPGDLAEAGRGAGQQEEGKEVFHALYGCLPPVRDRGDAHDTLPAYDRPGTAIGRRLAGRHLAGP